MLKRAVAFVDGFNVYHSLEENRLSRFKWLNLYLLAKNFIRSNREELTRVIYFTALASWDQEKVARHQAYIRALTSTGVFDVVYGQFKTKDRFCKNCRTSFPSREEKKTDVNIAIQMLQGAIENRYDTAYLISGDSDQLPAIRAVKSLYPDKEVGVILPYGRTAEDLKHHSDRYHRIKLEHLEKFQFPDSIDLGRGMVLQRPSTWR